LPSYTLTPIEETLLADLAVQAGLVLKNVGLTAELRARLEELRASRRRRVAAQDAERRRIERDLHDGLQQDLVAMLAKVRIVRNQAVRDPATMDATLEELNQEIREALKDLRELTRGIRPPVLSDQGLVKAIQTRVAHLPIEVAVEADVHLAGVRYAEEIEGAAYGKRFAEILDGHVRLLRFQFPKAVGESAPLEGCSDHSGRLAGVSRKFV